MFAPGGHGTSVQVLSFSINAMYSSCIAVSQHGSLDASHTILVMGEIVVAYFGLGWNVSIWARVIIVCVGVRGAQGARLVSWTRFLHHWYSETGAPCRFGLRYRLGCCLAAWAEDFGLAKT
jgi:hypothetical protein